MDSIRMSVTNKAQAEIIAMSLIVGIISTVGTAVVANYVMSRTITDANIYLSDNFQVALGEELR